MSTIALHSTLNISETIRDGVLVPKDHHSPVRNDVWGIKWSRDQWHHVILKGQTRDPNMLRVQYLENSWRCYWATIAYNCCLLWGSTVGYHSDSWASCWDWKVHTPHHRCFSICSSDGKM